MRAKSPTAAIVTSLLAWASTSGDARAFEPFAAEVPCTATATNAAGTVRACITCHDNADGGSGCPTPPCHNPFGQAFVDNGTRWTATLAALDSDGDGYSNGEELIDPMGAWTLGDLPPSSCGCATRPGFPGFTPGDVDADGDGYCCRGSDANGDGDCLDSGEHDGSYDCDEMDATAASGLPEDCTDPSDNDCDGLATISDPDCAAVVDRDGDGFCPMGRDDNGDGDCIDSGEMTADVDCDDAEPTVHPDASEHCLDTLDNDCNGLVDESDPTCRSDVDADMDGYCPIGRDLNGDGDCLDADEPTAGIDCDDSDPLANPDQTEMCTDGADNDCDGFADFRDPECRDFLDADGDGYCPAGRDGTGDGDCVDMGETGEPGDCDDEDPTVSPGAAESCTNSRDDDCDALVSLSDPDCETHLDGDGDGYCFVGFDMNGDGDCADTGEADGRGDCDDAVATVNPDVTEICTNGVDDDCDGVADASDQPTCLDYRDRDGDGWCVVGRDENGDGDCADAGEEQSPNDAGHDDEPTVYPGAPENCRDQIDNDLDSMIDEAGACVRDHDEDMDGYCPIGRDVNGDGDCLDADENYDETDCNDGDPEIHPGAAEACRMNVDLDCDGDIGLVDADCFFLLDRDRDGFCGEGIDDNGNGSCLDEGEDRFGADCNDLDPAINVRAVEDCANEIDDDCDGLIDREDPSCPCESDAACEDSDPCTIDSCSMGDCLHQDDPMCADSGPARTDGGMEPPVDAGCGCRAVGAGRGGAALLLLLALGSLQGRRRRARR